MLLTGSGYAEYELSVWRSEGYPGSRQRSHHPAKGSAEPQAQEVPAGMSSDRGVSVSLA